MLLPLVKVGMNREVAAQAGSGHVGLHSLPLVLRLHVYAVRERGSVLANQGHQVLKSRGPGSGRKQT